MKPIDTIAAATCAAVLGHAYLRELSRWHSRGLTPLSYFQNGRPMVRYRRSDLAAVLELRAAEIRAKYALDVADERIQKMRTRFDNVPRTASTNVTSTPSIARDSNVAPPSSLPTTCIHTTDPAKRNPRTCTRCYELAGVEINVRRPGPTPFTPGKSIASMFVSEVEP